MGKLATIPGAHLVPKINSAHRQAFGHATKATEYAAECGRLLNEAKDLVAHGDWGKWVDANTEVGWRQSQKYMRLARHWPEIEAQMKSDSDSHLGIEAALKLLREPPEELAKYLERTGQVVQSVTSQCGTPLYHREADGTYVSSQTGEPLPSDVDEPDDTGDEPDGADDDTRKPSVALEFAKSAAKSARESAAVLRENEDALVYELIKACQAASAAWDRLATRLIKKQASQKPQDGRSEGAADDPAPENEGDDIGDIPACLDRRRPKSSELFAKLEAELKKGGAHG